MSGRWVWCPAWWQVVPMMWADLQRQLAEARAALKRVDEMLEDARWESVIEWRETHAAAIKAAREEW